MYAERKEIEDVDSSLVLRFVEVLLGYMKPKDPAKPFSDQEVAENRRKSIIFLDSLA